MIESLSNFSVNVSVTERNKAPEGGFQPSPEFIQRVTRFKQAIALQEPDRVPFMPSMNMFYAYHYDMVTVKQWMEDCTTIIPSVQRFLQDYDPDVFWTPTMFPSKAMEAIGKEVWPKVECSDTVRWNVYPDGTIYLLNTEMHLVQEAIVQRAAGAPRVTLKLKPGEVAEVSD